MTWEVLLWAPGIGRTRLRALNVRAIREGHVNLAAPLGALTDRQRQLARRPPMPMNRSNRTDGLVVVHARDEVNRALAGHGGREYTSPPHQHCDALALVALLLERPVEPDEHDQTSWSRPLAGGQRTITLGPASPADRSS